MKQIITTSLTLIFVMLAGAVHAGVLESLHVKGMCREDFWEAKPTIADVQAELDKGASLGAVCVAGKTPLHVAAFRGTPDIIRLLISAGADVNASEGTYFGFAPIHAAINSAENMKALIEAGADVHIRTEAFRYEKIHTGPAPLHLAAGFGTVETVSILLEEGADIEVTDSGTQSTPLHAAAHEANIETARFLLAKRANIEARDKLAEADIITDFATGDKLDIGSLSRVWYISFGNDTILLTDSGDILAVLQGYTGTLATSDFVTTAAQFTITEHAYYKLTGTDGNDTLTAQNALPHNLLGGKGDDTLIGGAGDDRLFGNKGSDILDGQGGSDALTGGPGHDVFILNSGLSGLDIVTDFSFDNVSGNAEYDGRKRGGNDKLRIDLDDADITALNAKPTGAEKLAVLMDAGNIRWALGSSFSQDSASNDNTKYETLIYDTKGTDDLSDDVNIMILEDFSQELTIDMFEMV